jgi:hypothetical protein
LKYEDNPIIKTKFIIPSVELYHNYLIYGIIKNNNKPILILYENKIINTPYKYKHSYLIKNRNNYVFKYNYIFNNNHHKYLFDINASEISKYETNWYITGVFNYNLKEFIEIGKISIINWFINNINHNIKNYYYKKYLLFQFLTKKSAYKS